MYRCEFEPLGRNWDTARDDPGAYLIEAQCSFLSVYYIEREQECLDSLEKSHPKVQER